MGDIKGQRCWHGMFRSDKALACTRQCIYRTTAPEGPLALTRMMRWCAIHRHADDVRIGPLSQERGETDE